MSACHWWFCLFCMLNKNCWMLMVQHGRVDVNTLIGFFLLSDGGITRKKKLKISWVPCGYSLEKNKKGLVEEFAKPLIFLVGRHRIEL